MRIERLVITCCWRVIGFLTVAALFLVPVTSIAVGEEIGRLLQELGVQVPSRAMSAPPFSLSDANGAQVRLGDYKGRAVMMYFWTTY